MSNVDELIDKCISSLRSDAYEISHDIKMLKKELETYEMAISKLEELKEKQ